MTDALLAIFIGGNIAIIFKILDNINLRKKKEVAVQKAKLECKEVVMSESLEDVLKQSDELIGGVKGKFDEFNKRNDLSYRIHKELYDRLDKLSEKAEGIFDGKIYEDRATELRKQGYELREVTLADDKLKTYLITRYPRTIDRAIADTKAYSRGPIVPKPSTIKNHRLLYLGEQLHLVSEIEYYQGLGYEFSNGMVTRVPSDPTVDRDKRINDLINRSILNWPRELINELDFSGKKCTASERLERFYKINDRLQNEKARALALEKSDELIKELNNKAFPPMNKKLNDYNNDVRETLRNSGIYYS